MLHHLGLLARELQALWQIWRLQQIIWRQLPVFHIFITRSCHGISYRGFVDRTGCLKSAEQLQSKITYHAVRHLEFPHTTLHSQDCGVTRDLF